MYRQLTGVPIDVLKLQLGDLPRTKAEPSQQEQDGVVATATVCATVTAPDEPSTSSAEMKRGRAANRQFATVGTAAPRSTLVVPCRYAKRRKDRTAVTRNFA